MNRFRLALLASLLLGGQAWAQPAPAASQPPPLPSPSSADIGSDPVVPAPLGVPATPFVDVNDSDSCGCSGGCCNLAHPWRRLKSIINQPECSTCNLSEDTVCGPAGRFWVDFDVLYWHVGGDPLPALVTTSPTNPLTPVAQAGVLPAATVLVGAAQFNNDSRPGARLGMGAWLNNSQTFGIQFGGFMLADQSETVNLASPGSPILARPFTNVQANPAVQASQLVAYPDVVSGNIGVHERNTLQGYDFAVRGNVCCGSDWRIDALVGYRYLRFTEQLLIQERVVAGANSQTAIGIPTGTIVDSFDRFDTGNEFHALQAGFTGELRPWERISLSGTAKASFGVVNQGVGVDGGTRFSTDGVNRVGGLLALNSNIGTYRRSDSSLVPELILNFGYQVTNNIRLRVGYDLLYMPNVQRAGSVIDVGIDPRRIPPVTNPTVDRPTFDNNATDLFIQGIHGSLEFRF